MKKIISSVIIASFISSINPVFSQWDTKTKNIESGPYGGILIKEQIESGIHPNVTLLNQFIKNTFKDAVFLAGSVKLVQYGTETMDDGLVSLGRLISFGGIAGGVSYLFYSKYQRSWGSLDQLRVSVKYLDELERPTNKFLAGETGLVVLTIENKGNKRVKGVKPKLNIETRGDLEKINRVLLQNVETDGFKVFGSYRLGPDEILEVWGQIQIPLTTPETDIEILAALSPTLRGKDLVDVHNLNPPDLVLSDIKFFDQDPDGVLVGLETATISATITNQGDGPARNIRVLPSLNEGTIKFSPTEILLDELDQGQSKDVSFELEAGLETQDGSARIRIDVSEGRGFDARPMIAEIPTAKLLLPEIAIDFWKINDGSTGMADGNDNRLIENAETVEIRLEVKNKGAGPAYGLVLTPLVAGAVIPLSSDVSVGLIAPGGTVDATVAVNVPVNFRSPTINMDVNVKDDRNLVNYNKTIELESYYRKPELEFDYLIYDGNSPGSRGNQNGIIEQGEKIIVEILPQNMGDYQAVDVTFRLAIDYPGIIKPPTFRNEFLSVGKIPEKMNGNPVRFPLTIQRSAKPGSFTALVEMDQANFKGLKREITFDLEEEKIETVAFGQRQSSGFGRFGDREAEGIINVDVAPNLGKRARNAVAVVIGNRNYRIRGVPSVDYAERDARIFKSYLTRTLGLSESDVMYFTDASFTDFNEIFGTQSEYRGKLYSRVKSGTKVYVFYSGHGAPDVEEGTGYFVPSDSDPSKIKLTGYPVGLMKRNLAKLPTDDITVVIDACFSGQSDKGDFLIKGISPAMLKLKDPEVIRGVSVFSAATKNQVSSWYNDARHGVFTYYFLAGMQGLADKDGDRKVTYGEMDEYLQENIPGKVIEISSGQRDQKPTFIGDKRRVIVDLNE